jgi:hypothetical protein
MLRQLGVESGEAILVKGSYSVGLGTLVTAYAGKDNECST